MNSAVERGRSVSDLWLPTQLLPVLSGGVGCSLNLSKNCQRLTQPKKRGQPQSPRQKIANIPLLPYPKLCLFNAPLLVMSAAFPTFSVLGVDQ